MPTLTVRDIPGPVYDRLEEKLFPQPLDTEALIAEVEAFHARFDEPLPDLVAEGKRAGRKYEDDLAGEGLADGDLASDASSEESP